MSFKIKKLKSNDIKSAKRLFLFFQEDDGVKNPTVASDEYLSKLLSKDNFHVIVAIKKDTVIGGLVAYELLKYKQESTEMFLFEIGVEKSYRKKVVATALIEKLKEICAEKGVKEMFVGALADNKPALKLYEKTGGSGEKVVEFSYELV